MQTISEVAASLNITTQSVYSKINNTMQDVMQGFVMEEKRGNRLVKVITEEGVEVLRDSLESSTSNSNAKGEQVVDNELLELLQTTIDTLSLQLDVKDMQIQELNNIIKGLQKSNENSQILMGMQQEVKQLAENKGWWDNFKAKFK